MPLIHQQVIHQNTRVGVWHITEPLSFFTHSIQLQRVISHPQKQLQHAAGRYLLQYLQPHFPVNEIEITANNKPHIQNNTWHFSISHCGNYAAAIVSTKQQVGIDVEIPTTKVLKVAHKFLSHTERNHFNVLNILESPILLPTVLWSAKEALFKWWGNGEVDFKEHLQIQPFLLEAQGSFKAMFTHPMCNKQLQMQYIVFEEFVLVYLVNNL